MSQNPILPLLFENKMEEALKNMFNAYPDNDSIINFSARFHSLKNQQDDGVISQEAADVRESKIRAAMTNFLKNNEIENPNFELLYVSKPKSEPKTTMKNQPPILIFTALQKELDAVVEHLENLEDSFHPKTSTLYQHGTFATGNNTVNIVVIETEANNVKAATEVERAVSHFNPKYALFVGIAGGLKDVKIGDVVLARKIYAYEVGKAAKEYKMRFEFGEPSNRLKQYAKAVKRKKAWINRIDKKYFSADNIPTAFIEPIAAGEKVVSSEESATYKFLKQNCSDAFAVAMEEYGFAEAIKGHEGVSSIVIRGISDLIEGKSTADKAGSQELASANASAFAFELIETIIQQDPSILTSKTTAQTMSAVASPKNFDQWDLLTTTAKDIYKGGIEENNIWERAGGDIASQRLNLQANTQWYNAIKALKLGGGGKDITAERLIKAMLEDYSGNPNLNKLMESFL